MNIGHELQTLTIVDHYLIVEAAYISGKMLLVHNYLPNLLHDDEVSKCKWNSYLIEILIQLNFATLSMVNCCVHVARPIS